MNKKYFPYKSDKPNKKYFIITRLALAVARRCRRCRVEAAGGCHQPPMRLADLKPHHQVGGPEQGERWVRARGP